MTPRAVAIVDGEHYPPVVRHALGELPYTFVAAVLVGGKEKLRGEPEYGVPLCADLEEAIERYRPQVVVDLSDEPVLGPAERLALASRVLRRGLPYLGADFRFEPPPRAPFPLPSVAVVGTGKRVGKTAVTAHLARLLAARHRVVVVAMGRGGPPEPERIATPPTLEELVARSRAGAHAASDHLEVAALAGVETIGCRRCGGGLAGAVLDSNLSAGAALALELAPDVVIFDGSGAALPPVAAERTLVVVSGQQQPEVAAGYLNLYRLLLADLVLVTMAEPGTGWERVAAAVARAAPGVEVVPAVLRPRPAGDIRGRAVAFFCTAPPDAHAALARHLEEAHGARVTHVSGSLADRARLAGELERVDADVFLVELKAAAIDLVAEAGLERGVEVVLAASDVVAAPGAGDLDEKLLHLARIPR
ncbi:MAG TPA: hypothetical protein VNJ46_04320 [Gaiellaceae bacterium]|nr:hypothetical protein [Gaiellaceae bacterium]